MCNKAFVVQFKTLFRNYEETGENHEKGKIVCVPEEVQTWHLTSTSNVTAWTKLLDDRGLIRSRAKDHSLI
jgi:hypothetical protein